MRVWLRGNIPTPVYRDTATNVIRKVEGPKRSIFPAFCFFIDDEPAARCVSHTRLTFIDKGFAAPGGDWKNFNGSLFIYDEEHLAIHVNFDMSIAVLSCRGRIAFSNCLEFVEG